MDAIDIVAHSLVKGFVILFIIIRKGFYEKVFWGEANSVCF